MTSARPPDPEWDIVLPSREDPVVAAATEAWGGPVPAGSRPRRSWWSPLRILVVLSGIGFVIGLIQKSPCIASSWASPDRYFTMCYTDISPLYQLRGFAAGVFPFLGEPLPGQEYLEYPVLTGLYMQAAAWLTPAGSADPSRIFFFWNVLGLLAALIVTVVATALTVRRRPWDAAMVALAPALWLTATINWDLLAVALSAAFFLAWSRRRLTWAGVFLGLAIATKFYPILFLGPLLILCVRAGALRAFARTAAIAVATWLIINVPFMVANFEGWSHFYVFSQDRGQDFGSVWMMLSSLGLTIAPDTLNFVALALFGALCIALAVLILRAPRRPRFASVALLVLIAFVLTNKVYSPQFVLWLIPLAALARPRWRDFLWWQSGQVVYFASIWLYLAGLEADRGLPEQWYAVGILAHVASTIFLASVVIRDILVPSGDPVRNDGWPDDADDPGGGVLDGARDAVGPRSATVAGPVSD